MRTFNRIMRSAIPLALAAVISGLAACGGNGASAPAAVTTSSYSAGGAVSGLIGTVVLQDNGGDNLSLTANGNFTFATKILNGNTYNVTVLTQPTGQTCSVSTGSGTVSGSNVTNVAVVCSRNSYSVGGNVSGLTGSVVLQDNNGDNLSVTANGAITFATKVAFGSPYSVTVLTQPTGMSCSIANGTGTIAAVNVSNVAITCAFNTYTVGGTVTGLNGSVVLQDNGADNTTVSVNGPFNFPTAVAYGSPYKVTVLTQPAGQFCSVVSGSGSATANVSNVAIACASLMGGTIQGNTLNLTQTVSTAAGAFPGADGIGAAARIGWRGNTASDGVNLYVADTYNNKIRKIVIATGAVTTLAGTGAVGALDGAAAAASFNFGIGFPAGIAIDSTNTNLYVADSANNKIRKIVIATGAVSSLTGAASTAVVAGAVDGAAAAASFNRPLGIAIDSTNTNLYVADTYSNKIRQVAIATGAVSSLTGATNTIVMQGALDGAAATASFRLPMGIAYDAGTASLYVADFSNYKIRKIVLATNLVSSFTGVANMAGIAGAADGAAAGATFFNPAGITSDGVSLYVADSWNNKIRQVAIATGAVSSLTGTANTAGAAGFNDGTLAAATFGGPQSVTSAGGNLYVVDAGTIRKIAAGAVSTLAGAKPGADGTGALANIDWPSNITTDGVNLYVTDSNNNTIRQIAITTGAVTTLAGKVWVAGAVDGTGTAATFNGPAGITTDGVNLYVADQSNNKIRKIVIATGVVSSLTGAANTKTAWGAVDGAAAAASFNWPLGITTDGVNLYVVDSGNNKIRKIVIATGQVTSFTGTASAVMVAGAVDGAAAAANFNGPVGIVTDGANLYVADQNNNKIRKIAIATGLVSSFTGVANAVGIAGAADGAAAGASFNWPAGISTDGANLYVVDQANNKIRQIAIATGAVSSLTGAANTAAVAGAVNGTGSAALFSGPTDVVSDGKSLYVVDQSNSTIRKIQ